MTGRTIDFSSETDFLMKSGKIFLDELQRDASSLRATEAVRRDWQTVADWLGHTSGDISAENSERLGRAWNAYLSIGLAPSFELQTAFDLFAEQVGDVQKSDRAPTEVMNVFDRLLANDADIKAKREADLMAEKARFGSMFAQFKSEKSQSWWKKQPLIVRNWVFVSIVWIVFMTLYAMFFDPFDTGGWDYMSDSETTRLILIMLGPVGAGVVFYIYHRWVK